MLDALPDGSQALLTVSPPYQRLFLDWTDAAVRKAADAPSLSNLSVVVFHIFVILESALALSTFSVIRQVLKRARRFPGLLQGMTFVHRDEVRHAQLGLCLLQEFFAGAPTARVAVQAHLEKVLPTFSEVLTPRSARRTFLESFGLDPLMRRRKAFAHLQRNLRLLGIDSSLVEPWIGALNLHGEGIVEGSVEHEPA